jgi:hypothetical protein
MIVRCIWHKPLPIYLRDKPPLEDKRISDGMCETCMRKMFKEAGMKVKARGDDTREPKNELDS